VKNVLILGGYNVDCEHVDAETTKVVSVLESEITNILYSAGLLGLENLGEMLLRACAAIDIYESDGSSLAQMFRDERREKTREREMQRV
jgi:hypothetical protein